MKKQVLLSVHFRNQGKEKQKIHFTNANTNNSLMKKFIFNKIYKGCYFLKGKL